MQIHGLPPGIVQVAAGGIHAVALAADGSVWTWGANNAGQLGYPTPGAQYSTVPHQVPGVSGVKQVAAGADFTVALRSNGEVWTWGGNDHGQLGDGTHTDRTTPARNQAGYGMTQVSAGGYYALARRAGIGVGVGRQRLRAARQRLHRGGQRHPGHRRPAHAERHADRGRLHPRVRGGPGRVAVGLGREQQRGARPGHRRARRSARRRRYPG